jgi:nitrogen regulatory protein P-II 1
LKLVIGIVRPEKANDVLEALYRVETYRGTRVKMELTEKVRFELAVSDAFVQRTIEALQEGGQTGEGAILAMHEAGMHEAGMPEPAVAQP